MIALFARAVLDLSAGALLLCVLAGCARIVWLCVMVVDGSEA